MSRPLLNSASLAEPQSSDIIQQDALSYSTEQVEPPQTSTVSLGTTLWDTMSLPVIAAP